MHGWPHAGPARSEAAPRAVLPAGNRPGLLSEGWRYGSGSWAGCVRATATATPGQLRDAVLEYAETWSERWAHRFDWDCAGVGLQQKAVVRFIGMLRRSAEELTLQLLTKEPLLMVNLMDGYRDEVEPEHWQELFDAVRAAEQELRTGIAASTRPIVKRNAADALDRLLGRIEAATAMEAVA